MTELANLYMIEDVHDFGIRPDSSLGAAKGGFRYDPLVSETALG